MPWRLRSHHDELTEEEVRAIVLRRLQLGNSEKVDEGSAGERIGSS